MGIEQCLLRNVVQYVHRVKFKKFLNFFKKIFTRTFKLGRVNGVDEGLVVVELFFFFTGYFG